MYTSGSSQNVNSLLDTLAVFCQSSGYTINSIVGDGDGKRLHISKNNRYYNFRSFVNESVLSYSNNQYAIFMNASTGYSGASAWYNQANAMTYNDGSSKYFLAGMVRLTSSIDYHFFNFSGTYYDVVYVFLKNQDGVFQHMLFGSIDTSKYGTTLVTSEGMFFQASKHPFNNTYSNSITLFGDGIDGIFNANPPQGAIYLNYLSNSRWHSGNFSIAQGWLSPQRPQVIDSICKKATLINNLGGIGDIPTFLPVEIYQAQNTDNITSNFVPLIPIGELPFLYFTNISNYSAGGDLLMVKDSYKVFPFSLKSESWNPLGIESYKFGLVVLNG